MKLTGDLLEIAKLKKSGKITMIIPKEKTVELENFCNKPLLIRFSDVEIDAEIDNVRERSGLGRVVFRIDRDDTIHFAGRSEQELSLDVRIDAGKQLEIMSRISGDQRNKIFALCGDIGNYLGETKENARENLTVAFCADTSRERFSLSDCDSETAGEFIEWLITFAFEFGVPLNEHPRKYIDDLDKVIEICLAQKKCIICGKPSEEHHVDAIGMGRDRRRVDDSDMEKWPLCREHHTEAHKLGKKTFAKKYHLPLEKAG